MWIRLGNIPRSPGADLHVAWSYNYRSWGLSGGMEGRKRPLTSGLFQTETMRRVASITLRRRTPITLALTLFSRTSHKATA